MSVAHDGELEGGIERVSRFEGRGGETRLDGGKGVGGVTNRVVYHGVFMFMQSRNASIFLIIWLKICDESAIVEPMRISAAMLVDNKMPEACLEPLSLFSSDKTVKSVL